MGYPWLTGVDQFLPESARATWSVVSSQTEGVRVVRREGWRLASVWSQSNLVHADYKPWNLLVRRSAAGWASCRATVPPGGARRWDTRNLGRLSDLVSLCTFPERAADDPAIPVTSKPSSAPLSMPSLHRLSSPGGYGHWQRHVRVERLRCAIDNCGPRSRHGHDRGLVTNAVTFPTACMSLTRSGRPRVDVAGGLDVPARRWHLPTGLGLRQSMELKYPSEALGGGGLVFVVEVGRIAQPPKLTAGDRIRESKVVPTQHVDVIRTER